jgi:hypothetical protein
LLKCIAATAYNAAVIYWKAQNYKDCLPFVAKSCEWMMEMKVTFGKGFDHLPKRFELYATCAQKMGDNAVSYRVSLSPHH